MADEPKRKQPASPRRAPKRTGGGELSPPHDEAAERAVLSAIFFDNRVYDEVSDIIDNDDDFYRAAHRIVYGAMRELAQRREAIDVVTVSDLLTQRDELGAAGGSDYLIELAGAVGSAANANYHARIISRYALLRRLIHTTGELSSDAYSRPENLDEFLQDVERKIFEVSQQRLREGFTHAQPLITATMNELARLFENSGDITGLATGFTDFDHKTSGLFPGNLVIVAGRPGMGKTAFCLNVAANVAARSVLTPTGDETNQKHVVAFFSLEMSKHELAIRLLAAEANVPMQRIKSPRYSKEDEWQQMLKAADKLSTLNLWVDESADLNIYELRSKARRLKAQAGRLDLIVIDYLQLMTSRTRYDARHLEVAEITRSLKALGKELQVPIMALAQLSRQAESRKDHVPLLSDLRESGSIEQDADMVLFIHRPGYYNKEDQSLANVAKLILAKNRSGPTGDVDCYFFGETMRFENAARGDG